MVNKEVMVPLLSPGLTSTVGLSFRAMTHVLFLAFGVLSTTVMSLYLFSYLTS